ncbi:hypothetical protein B0H16DRAFT_1737728 [Mycena metata]|uniref:Uncharacterized protein n=1 Tax=Mycena metata TaxID=1033252 RepID=A0AAD7HK24_9AGAR|nr:hypothetical protein B0H16DRAFT_1737728 [Mycena metata]
MTNPNRPQSPTSTFVPFVGGPTSYILMPIAAFAVAQLPVVPFITAQTPPVKDKEAPTPKDKEAVTPPAPAARVPPGAGLPAPLLALMRSEDGPFTANEVFSVPPAQPLAPVDEEVPAPEWYAITRGRFVGVVDQFALSAVAISGVAHNASKAYPTQALALNAFNQALTWGGVQVV